MRSGLRSLSYSDLLLSMPWGDVIQVEASVTNYGKHGIRFDWLICDCKKMEVLIRASSNLAIMNKSTRRLSKMPDEIQAKLNQYVVDRPPVIIKQDARMFPKLDETNAHHVCSGLMTKWSDLDVNGHANNVKYTRWILESVPNSIMKYYEIASMTLEYHQECKNDCKLKSLISIFRNDNDGSNQVDCNHMLRLEDGGNMIMKGWSRWRSKYQNS
ncbi:hypothetical protein R6Q57_029213 [Mikania cordata]